jgi:hypothetical protein
MAPGSSPLGLKIPFFGQLAPPCRGSVRRTMAPSKSSPV